jgi:hypothetical protein
MCVVVWHKNAEPCMRLGKTSYGRGPHYERIPAEPSPPMGRGVCDEVWCVAVESAVRARQTDCPMVQELHSETVEQRGS